MQKITKSINIENKIYMWTVALLPVLSMYKSPISALDLGTFLGLPIILFCYLSHHSKSRITQKITRIQILIEKKFLIVCLYILIITVVNLIIGLNYNDDVMTNPDKFQMVLRCIKLIATSLLIIYCGNRLMIFEYFMAVYWKIVKIAVIYIILQTICFYLFKFVLPPFITSLIREDYAYILDYNYHKNMGLFRPMSFFYEPAHFSEFCIPYLTYSLFKDASLKKSSFKRALFISLGIILSTSGIGCVFMALMWLVVFIRSLKTKNGTIALFLLLAVLCCLPFVFTIPVFQKAFERLFQFSGSDGAIQIRMSSGYSIFADLGLFAKIFGIGYGNYPPSYAISFSYSLISMGIIGTIIFLRFIFKLILKSNGFTRALSCVLFLLMFVTMIFTTGFTLYLPCIIFSSKERKRIDKSSYDYSKHFKQRSTEVFYFAE